MTIVWGNQRETLKNDVNQERRALARRYTWQHDTKLKGLILAQNERWRRGLGMQVVRSIEGSNTDYA